MSEFNTWFNRHHAVKTAYGADYILGAERGFKAGQTSKQAEIDKLKNEIAYLNDVRKSYNSNILNANHEIRKLKENINTLLCEDHYQQCNSENGLFKSKSPDDEPCLICLLNSIKDKTTQTEGFEWISVNTKLPEDSEYVLCVHEGGNQHVMVFTKRFKNKVMWVDCFLHHDAGRSLCLSRQHCNKDC